MTGAMFVKAIAWCGLIGVGVWAVRVAYGVAADMLNDLEDNDYD